MKQIFRRLIDRGGKIRLEEVPRPLCDAKSIIVSNVCSLISIGTELQMAKVTTKTAVGRTLKDKKLKDTVLKLFKDLSFTDFLCLVKEELLKKYPTGYSGAGRVIEVGREVEGINVGDKVAYGGSGHAEIVKVSKNLFVKLPDNVSFEAGAFVTLGTVPIQAIRTANLSQGEYVVLYGLGLVGLLTVQILNAYGFKTIGIDIDDERIQYGLNFGMHFGINPKKTDMLSKINEITDGQGADATIICAAAMKNNEIVNNAFAVTRKKGKVVIVGKVGLNLERPLFYQKELTLLISVGYGPGRYDRDYEEKGIDYPYPYVRWTAKRNMEEFVYLLKEKKINIESVISDEVEFKEAEKIYEKLHKDNSYNPIGVLLRYSDETDDKKAEDYKLILSEVSPQLKDKKRINVGLVGCGNFSRTTLLPSLKKIDKYTIYALCDTLGQAAKQFGDQYKAHYITTNYKELIEDENIDMLIIATTHNTHAQIAIEALQNGKVVFSEKPMAINIGELEKLREVIQKCKKPYFVGFNRRYTDFAHSIKSSIDNSPAIIKCSITTKKLPSDSWLIDPEIGGGRLIGEACHFFEFINFVTGKMPKEIYATVVNPNNKNFIGNNNFIVTIKYENGSLGQIIYSDLGTPNYPKEKIEIHSNGMVMEVIDFKTLMIHGTKPKRFKKKKVDKGHFNELKYIAQYLKGEKIDVIPSLEENYLASLMSFKALESMEKGKAVKIKI